MGRRRIRLWRIGGGGVDGAIHQAAGPALLEECKKLGGAKPGEVKFTGAHKLPARWVAHAVGPRDGNPDVLVSCYREAIKQGLERGAVTFAFPSIATGAFGFPLEQAAQIAVRTLIADIEETRIAFVRIVCFDETTLAAYKSALKSA